MSQNDFNVDDANGLAVLNDMNSAFKALASMSSGPVAPAVSYPGQMFMLTTGASPDQPVAIQVREYNTATWRTIMKWNATSAQWEPNADVIQALTTAGITFKNAAGTPIGALTDSGALTIPGALSAASVPMPARLGPTYQNVTDWNLAQETGFYAGLDAANAPLTSWFLGTVIVHNSAWIVQEVVRFSTNIDPGGDLFYYRRELNNGIWGAWERIYKNKFEIDALIDAKTGTPPQVTAPVTSVAQNAAVEIAHTLTGLNKVSCYYTCLTAEGGYAVGDKLEISSYLEQQAGSGVQIYFTDTLVGIKRGNYPLRPLAKNTYFYFTLTNTYWNMTFVLEKL